MVGKTYRFVPKFDLFDERLKRNDFSALFLSMEIPFYLLLMSLLLLMSVPFSIHNLALTYMLSL